MDLLSVFGGQKSRYENLNISSFALQGTMVSLAPGDPSPGRHLVSVQVYWDLKAPLSPYGGQLLRIDVLPSLSTLLTKEEILADLAEYFAFIREHSTGKNSQIPEDWRIWVESEVIEWKTRSECGDTPEEFTNLHREGEFGFIRATVPTEGLYVRDCFRLLWLCEMASHRISGLALPRWREQERLNQKEKERQAEESRRRSRAHSKALLAEMYPEWKEEIERMED